MYDTEMPSYLLQMLELLGASSLLQPFFFTVVAIFLILLYKWSSTSSTTAKNSSPDSPPPSPPKLPIIGNYHQLGSHPHRWLQATSQRHDPDLMLIHLGSVPVLVVSSAEAAREVFKTHDTTFSGRPMSTIYGKLLYNYKDIASAPYGEYWKKVRSICVQNLLSTRSVRSFRGIREDETKSMIDKIKNSSSSSSLGVLDLSEMFVTLSNDVVCRVALGKKYSTSGGEGGIGFKELLGEFMRLLGHIDIVEYIPWLAWLNRVNGLDAQVDKVSKQLDDFVDGVVQEHMDYGSKSGDDDRKDFVDVLLGIQQESLDSNFPIDRVTIKAIILDMFVAGTDTSSTLLEWAMSELLKHPKVMSKLQNELRGTFGNRTDIITDDDLVGMHYLKAVVKETLRLHPAAPLLMPRMATQDVKINGYDIKANTPIMINAWAIGRDPRSYDRPEKFEPERFLNSGIDYKGNHFQFIPFGAGRRICPGIQFGIAVNETALANVVHKFDWALPGGANGEDLDMTELSGLTVHRKYHLKAVATPYSGLNQSNTVASFGK